MFIALNSWFWPVRACLKCLPSDCAKGPLCRHVNVPAGVTCTLVVNYTTLQRVTPTPPPSLSDTVMSPPACISGTANTGLRKCINLDTECTASSLVSPVCVNRVMCFCGSFLAKRLPETKQSTRVKFCGEGVLLA